MPTAIATSLWWLDDELPWWPTKLRVRRSTPGTDVLLASQPSGMLVAVRPIVLTRSCRGNAKAGTLLIGVDDDGTIVGLDADYASLSNRPS